MRIVLDACVPQPFRHALPGHIVHTARHLGLSRLDDGTLLRSLAGQYDVLVTCDRNIPWQNQITGLRLAVVILRARTNKLSDLLPLAPQLIRALPFLSPGYVRQIA